MYSLAETPQPPPPPPAFGLIYEGAIRSAKINDISLRPLLVYVEFRPADGSTSRIDVTLSVDAAGGGAALGRRLAD
jgi:hypothetical protein